MMKRTPIEWVKNPDLTPGFAWNPVTGCLNGCPYCYARRLAGGRLKERYLHNNNISITGGVDIDDPFAPRFWPGRLGAPLSRKEASGIFVCDMGELFGPWLPDGWIDTVFEVIKATPHHRYYLLTKQPEMLPEYNPFPDNCWVGVSATGTALARLAAYYLEQVVARVKFVSFEPLLSAIVGSLGELMTAVDWAVIGGRSGPMPFHPPVEWVRAIEAAADEAGVPVFEKYNLSENGKAGLRQEIPQGMGYG
ncbi:MAG: DUF5131 family protein [Chloroflexota bacterium]